MLLLVIHYYYGKYRAKLYFFHDYPVIILVYNVQRLLVIRASDMQLEHAGLVIPAGREVDDKVAIFQQLILPAGILVRTHLLFNSLHGFLVGIEITLNGLLHIPQVMDGLVG